ncbi:uncharacterized protein LOC116603412 isoform X2 [Nematostella vectensis]|uniref:uncharacterized protein LOC116603412 isoform X2 n=1 Tax=Nematostella vectensis TaxID=45351 RepID=UPI0020771616|nr:uncharacterized protein LOC116603412 isoform X2 [Nematostella vectensis]
MRLGGLVAGFTLSSLAVMMCDENELAQRSAEDVCLNWLAWATNAVVACYVIMCATRYVPESNEKGTKQPDDEPTEKEVTNSNMFKFIAVGSRTASQLTDQVSAGKHKSACVPHARGDKDTVLSCVDDNFVSNGTEAQWQPSSDNNRLIDDEVTISRQKIKKFVRFVTEEETDEVLHSKSAYDEESSENIIWEVDTEHLSSQMDEKDNVKDSHGQSNLVDREMNALCTAKKVRSQEVEDIARQESEERTTRDDYPEVVSDGREGGRASLPAPKEQVTSNDVIDSFPTEGGYLDDSSGSSSLVVDKSTSSEDTLHDWSPDGSMQDSSVGSDNDRETETASKGNIGVSITMYDSPSGSFHDVQEATDPEGSQSLTLAQSAEEDEEVKPRYLDLSVEETIVRQKPEESHEFDCEMEDMSEYLFDVEAVKEVLRKPTEDEVSMCSAFSFSSFDDEVSRLVSDIEAPSGQTEFPQRPLARDRHVIAIRVYKPMGSKDVMLSVGTLDQDTGHLSRTGEVWELGQSEEMEMLLSVDSSAHQSFSHYTGRYSLALSGCKYCCSDCVPENIPGIHISPSILGDDDDGYKEEDGEDDDADDDELDTFRAEVANTSSNENALMEQVTRLLENDVIATPPHPPASTKSPLCELSITDATHYTSMSDLGITSSLGEEKDPLEVRKMFLAAASLPVIGFLVYKVFDK